MSQKRLLVPVLIIASVAAAVFCTAPKSEDFWWTDGASFALNGELIHDYFASGFHQSPMAFANEWFRRYPALTISLYPPIFPIAEAFAFSIFGFSHTAAQATVAGFTLMAAAGFYRTLRTALAPLEAAAGVFVLFAAPGILLWSRQVVMDLPALAFLLMASGCFLQYQAGRRPRSLYFSTLLILCAVYTKQTAIFAAPAFAIALVVSDGWRRLRDRTVWIAATIGVLGLIPIAAFTLVAARQLVDVALHGKSPGPGHFAQAQAYALAVPDVVGWPALIAAACYAAMTALRGWRNAAEQRLAVLMLSWFGCGFVFISITAHFETRYAMALAVPCAAASVLLLVHLADRRPGAWIVPGVAAALFVFALSTNSVNRMTGYDKVAAYILDHSKQDDVIWFQGAESKNLTFSLRSYMPGPKIYLLRAEKFLVDYHEISDVPTSDRGWTFEGLRDLIDRSNVSMIVLQPNFWTDLPSMNRMQDYAYSDRFRQVAQFPITADESSQRTTIKIFVRQ